MVFVVLLHLLMVYLGVRVDVAQVSGNTGGVNNVVEREVRDQRRLLEEERQGLTDTTSSTKNGNPRSNRGSIKSKKKTKTSATEVLLGPKSRALSSSVVEERLRHVCGEQKSRVQ